jgi:hypothetical protein
MFAIWEIDGDERLVTEAGTLDVALDKVDNACRLRHDSAMARVGPVKADGCRFEIRSSSGRALARLDYHPDVTRPYTSVIVEELRTGARRRR